MCVRNEPAGGDLKVIVAPRNMGKTIIAEALDRELPYLPPEEVSGELLQIYRQVGQLEDRGAVLERVIKTLCRRYCGLRDNGYCDLLCPGRDYCDTEGLIVIRLGGARGTLAAAPTEGGGKEPENQGPRGNLGNAGDVY